MHHGSDDTPRLSRALRFLQAHRYTGVTTAEIQAWTGSMAPATDISELRRSGHLIECSSEGMKNGRRIYRYRYQGRQTE
jgi:hypothetical protein